MFAEFSCVVLCCGGLAEPPNDPTITRLNGVIRRLRRLWRGPPTKKNTTWIDRSLGKMKKGSKAWCHAKNARWRRMRLYVIYIYPPEDVRRYNAFRIKSSWPLYVNIININWRKIFGLPSDKKFRVRWVCSRQINVLKIAHDMRIIESRWSYNIER